MLNQKKQLGFTLLEMVLVVFIMSGLSLMAVSFIDNEDSQYRYEETRDKLLQIRKAVLGNDQLLVNGQFLQSGYVVDNGLLPASVQDLIALPTDYDVFTLHAPIFDAEPDATTGINDDAGVVLNDSDEKLFKGYRAGAYLQTNPGSTEFYDGWGNGFLATPATNTIKFESRGLSNAIGGIDYEEDVSVTIEANWLVNIEGWSLSVVNKSGLDLAIGNGAGEQCARVSLLVFINDDQDNAYNWKRLTSNCIAGNASLTADGSCLDGDGDGLVAEVACQQSATVTFPADAFQPSMLIPNGEHIAVLVIDDDTPHNGSTAEAMCLGSADCSTGERTSQRIRFVPNTLRPVAELVIR